MRKRPGIPPTPNKRLPCVGIRPAFPPVFARAQNQQSGLGDEHHAVPYRPYLRDVMLGRFPVLVWSVAVFVWFLPGAFDR